MSQYLLDKKNNKIKIATGFYFELPRHERHKETCDVQC